VTFGAIMVDPPWPIQTIGKFDRPHRAGALRYDLMSLPDIKSLPVASLAGDGAHLWIWATNGHLRAAFEVLEAWGAKYLTTLTWVKPSGFGSFFANTTQHLLFGYYGKCRLKERFLPTNYAWVPRGHSRKPDHAYRLVERVSFGPYVELFARERRFGWTTLGNEIDGLDIAESLRLSQGVLPLSGAAR
jgi:N6-adenosine-specific RNA methylase IME4